MGEIDKEEKRVVSARLLKTQLTSCLNNFLRHLLTSHHDQMSSHQGAAPIPPQDTQLGLENANNIVEISPERLLLWYQCWWLQ